MLRRFRFRIAVAAVTAAALAALAACEQYAVAADPSATPSATPELTPVPADPPGDPCAVEAIAEGSAAEVVRVGTGCMPIDRAVLIRCDPSGPPAVVVDASTDPRTFLGGRYAVPLEGPPAAPVELGVTTAGRIWRSESDTRRLFVEASGEWERWLALATPSDLSPVPSAFLIGDSILDGAAEAVTEALPGWDVTVDAEVGRGSSTAAGIAEAMPDPHPDVVVIQIGTNDHDPVGFAQAAERIFAATSQADLVVWVTVHSPDSGADGINAAIRSAVGRVPQAVLADWETFVADDALNGDGVHPSPGNEHLMADLLAPILEEWRAAVGAATDCAPGAG
ncbi:MAG: hypothetical protein WD096_08915 [Actinomycetota bacterium]